MKGTKVTTPPKPHSDKSVTHKDVGCVTTLVLVIRVLSTSLGF